MVASVFLPDHWSDERTIIRDSVGICCLVLSRQWYSACQFRLLGNVSGLHVTAAQRWLEILMKNYSKTRCLLLYRKMKKRQCWTDCFRALMLGVCVLHWRLTWSWILNEQPWRRRGTSCSHVSSSQRGCDQRGAVPAHFITFIWLLEWSVSPADTL